MEITARANRKPEIHKESAAAEKFTTIGKNVMGSLHAQRDSCGAFLPFNGGFLLFQFQNRSGSVGCPGKYPPKHSGTRGAKGTFVLLRAGMDDRAQLDWRGHRCKKSGALADIERGEIESGCFFRMVTNKEAPRATARRLWSRS